MGEPLDSLNRSANFSIVIEWENARFAELQRTRKMLRELRKQLDELNPASKPAEVIFIYDRGVIDVALIERVLAEEFPVAHVAAKIRVIPADGLRYYQQKNFGAVFAEGKIVIFLDCDVIPESGWLAAQLDAFRNPEVSVVCGQTYIEYTGIYSKAFALFWFFPLRNPATDLRKVPSFYANNVAFRREVFHEYPFPELPFYRGQCQVLGATLRAKEIGIYRQMKARVSHPCPRGIRHFVDRALNAGRDSILITLYRTGKNRLTLGTVAHNFVRNMRYAGQRLFRHRREVGLDPVGAVAGYAIAAAFFALTALGEIATLVRPSLVQRLFPG